MYEFAHIGCQKGRTRNVMFLIKGYAFVIATNTHYIRFRGGHPWVILCKPTFGLHTSWWLWSRVKCPLFMTTNNEHISSILDFWSYSHDWYMFWNVHNSYLSKFEHMFRIWTFWLLQFYKHIRWYASNILKLYWTYVNP